MKYYTTALVMGILWFLVLYPFAGGLPLGGELFPWDLLAMCLASLIVAGTFRRRITQASRRASIMLGILLPCVGSFIFGVFFTVFMALQNVAAGGSLPDRDAWKVPFMCVVFGVFGLCFISIPMGLFSQFVMQRVARTTPR